MNSLIIPQLAAVQDDGTIGSICIDEGHGNPHAGFMFTTESSFREFVDSQPETNQKNLRLEQLEYPAVLKLLEDSREKMKQLEFVILDYRYNSDPRRNKLYFLFDLNEAVESLRKWTPDGFLKHPFVSEMRRFS